MFPKMTWTRPLNQLVGKFGPGQARKPKFEQTNFVPWHRSTGLQNSMLHRIFVRTLWDATHLTDWKKAVSQAEKIVGYPTSFMSLRCLLSDELSNVAFHMRKLVGTKHPLLKTARRFLYDGKHSVQMRGLIVLLISKAAGPTHHQEDNTEAMVSGIYHSQRSLAEITEMIHTANLIHKGVVNMADLQPNDDGIKDMEFGNKMAVLSGDFLLANASTALADLDNTKVVGIMSSAIGNLMEAEFTPLRDKEGHPVLPPGGASIEDWHQQTFLSVGCLMAKSCQAAMLLADHDQAVQDKAYEFGRQLAYAHQLHEDLQPYLGSREESKRACVTSAPVILHLNELFGANTTQEVLQAQTENLHKLFNDVHGGPGPKKAKEMCVTHGQKALEAIKVFPASDARTALENMVHAVT